MSTKAAAVQSRAPRREAEAVVSPVRGRRPRGLYAGIDRLQRAAGNRAVHRWLQAKLYVSRSGDRHEREADRTAERVIRTPLAVGAPRTGAAPRIAPPVARRGDGRELTAEGAERLATLGGGKPLPADLRGFFETGFGRDLSGVRLHTDLRAAMAAAALGARAFTLGRDIGFAPGQLAPATLAGRRLLAHELAHTVQQGAASSPPRVVCRQPKTGGAGKPSTFQPPGTGLVVTVDPPEKSSLLKMRTPLPARVHVTNIGSPGKEPTFVLDLSPERLIGTVLGSFDLKTRLRPGTPPSRYGDPASLARIRLINPVVSVVPAAGKLHGVARLSLGSDYPPAFAPATDVRVAFSSSRLGRFQGEAWAGPLKADFKLRLHYDTKRLERAMAGPAGERLKALWGELRRPGFTARGRYRLGPLALGSFRATTPTTVSLERPLLGAPTGYPLTYGAYGVVPAPPGSIAETMVPAFGATYSSYGEKTGLAATAAILPTVSPTAIRKEEPKVNWFPVYAYAEGTYVRRVAKGVDLGLRLTVQISTPELAKLGAAPSPPGPGERLQQMLQQYKEQPGPGQWTKPTVPNIGLTLFGRFP